MKISLEHIALWTNDLEKGKTFYCLFFDGKANELYHNTQTGFKFYFLSISSEARLEIMEKAGIPENLNERKTAQHIGLIHLAFGVDSKEEVESKAWDLAAAGFEILWRPRTTGDGYYEFETLDPEGNRLEVTFKLD